MTNACGHSTLYIIQQTHFHPVIFKEQQYIIARRVGHRISYVSAPHSEAAHNEFIAILLYKVGLNKPMNSETCY